MGMPKEFDSRYKTSELIVERPNCHVYKATDSQLGDREVALKIFIDRPNGDESLIEQFNDEIKALRAASHPVLVPIISAGCDQDYFYLSMELIPDGSMRERIKIDAIPKQHDKILAILEEIAEGLGELHEQGIVHGHLDTRAILFKGQKARLAGYCPAAIEAILKSQTSANRFAIDPAYIAPEQISSSDGIDHRADIYALAVIAFELYAGKRPFQSSNPLQMAMMRVTEAVPSASGTGAEVSALVDAALMKGMAKDPAERFQTIEQFVSALKGGKGDDEEEGELGSEGRLSTETIAVSMSTEQLQQMMGESEGSGGAALEVEQTLMSAPRPEITAMNSSDSDEKLDVGSTMMGVNAENVLYGSFGVLSGSLAGKRFALDSQQLMIGSDSGCGICIAEKGVPSRHAIVVKRGSTYNVAALSGKGLVLNDEEIEDSEEHELKRGDVLKVGDSELRFIAPGEVFTFHDDVADRVVDRPKSKAGRYIAAITSLIVTLCLVGGYQYWEATNQQKSMAAKKARKKGQERKQVIATLLKEGDTFLREGALIEPPENNARERFRQIIELDPEHTYAKRRLVEIKDRLVLLKQQERDRTQLSKRIAALAADGAKYMKAGSLVYPPGRNARDTYKEILRLEPKNEMAAAKIKEIEGILGDIVDKVIVYLARAQVYFDLGQYLKPRGQNAHELLKEVLKIDPENESAHEALVDLAAHTVFEIDQALDRWDLEHASDSLDAALALNVNRGFLKGREERFRLMKISRRGTVIPLPAERHVDYRESDKAGGYIDTGRIQSKLAKIRLKLKRSHWKDRAILVRISSN